MEWIGKSELSSINTVSDLDELISVMLDDKLTEFQYVIENEKFVSIIK